MTVDMMIRCNNCFEEYDGELGLCPFCGHVNGEPSIDAFCLTPGTIIANRYVIGQKTNSGGFGIVYKAWDKKRFSKSFPWRDKGDSGSLQAGA